LVAQLSSNPAFAFTRVDVVQLFLGPVQQVRCGVVGRGTLVSVDGDGSGLGLLERQMRETTQQFLGQVLLGQLDGFRAAS